jgi:hypothetical protein
MLLRRKRAGLVDGMTAHFVVMWRGEDWMVGKGLAKKERRRLQVNGARSEGFFRRTTSALPPC